MKPEPRAAAYGAATAAAAVAAAPAAASAASAAAGRAAVAAAVASPPETPKPAAASLSRASGLAGSNGDCVGRSVGADGDGGAREGVIVSASHHDINCSDDESHSVDTSTISDAGADGSGVNGGVSGLVLNDSGYCGRSNGGAGGSSSSNRNDDDGTSSSPRRLSPRSATLDFRTFYEMPTAMPRHWLRPSPSVDGTVSFADFVRASPHDVAGVIVSTYTVTLCVVRLSSGGCRACVGARSVCNCPSHPALVGGVRCLLKAPVPCRARALHCRAWAVAAAAAAAASASAVVFCFFLVLLATTGSTSWSFTAPCSPWCPR